MSEPASGGKGLLARIAGSAEYSIAAALIGVCVVVGAALWLLRPQEEDVAAATPATAASAPAGAAMEEDAALDDWKRKLDEDLGALDDAQRKRAAEEEARRTRQRAEEAAAAESRRKAELAAQARAQAEAQARQPAPAAPVASVAVAPKRPATLEDAAIDWSSCRRPVYPASSVRRGEEGIVTIAVDLDAAAGIRQARVSQSSGHDKLDRVTLEAVQRCRFTPAREDGVARAATAQVRFNWQLQK